MIHRESHIENRSEMELEKALCYHIYSYGGKIEPWGTSR